MNPMQAQLAQFHAEVVPATNDRYLRARLIQEECEELVVALFCDRPLDEVLQEMCDVLYVVFGTAVALKVDIEPYFNEVHRANLGKAGGDLREDGKILKPEGWQPPKIREMVESRVGMDTE